MDSGKLQPALYGGLVIGVLSALPIVNAGNCCCCLWVIAGGMLAVYLRQQNTPFSVTAADGALIGLLAGLIGGVLSGLLSIPFHALTAGFQQQMLERLMASNPDLPPEVRQQMERFAAGAALRTVGALVNVFVFTVFGMIGGLLGAAVFKRNAPPPPHGTVDVLPPE